MKQLALRVTTLSPLAIRADHSPTGADAAPYIPGSTLVGSLIAAHRLLRPGRTDEFAAFFLNDNVLYSNLYPATFKNRTMQDAFSPLYCIPRTAQTCKRFQGFLPLPGDESDDDAPHGVRDSLFDWAAFALLDKMGQTEAERGAMIATLEAEQSRICPRCKGPLDNFRGFYRQEEHDYAVPRAEKRLLTRTGINRKYGTVEEQILYSREVYEEQNSFFGIIQAEDHVAQDLKNFLLDKGGEENSSLLLTDFARLGTSRTRGFGRVEFEVELQEDTQEDREAQFKERLSSFDQALREHIQIPEHRPFYLALTLHAPALLSDELLRYESAISEERLAMLTGEPTSTFELLYHTASVRRIMGWQDLWGLPRGHEYAIDAGSVFLFAITRPLDEQLTHALFLLEEQGIGQRRSEGFGRLCVSDPFHKERNLR